MVSDGKVVTVPDSTIEQTADSFPDLRSMKKKDRVTILKEKLNGLKTSIRDFLVGLKKGSFEFEINGNIIEAKLYDTGIREVLDHITQEKANMLLHSDKVFQNAEYLYTLPDYEGNPDVYRWNYFYCPVQIGDTTVGVRIAVRDMVRANESQIYNWDIKKAATLGAGKASNQADQSPASSEAANSADANAPATGDISSVDTVPQNGAPVNGETTVERTNGQDERGYTGPLVDTQDRVFETQLTDEEKQIPGLTAEEARHLQHHDAEVDIRAKERIAAGVNQARADLLAAESWSDEDTATAGYIIQAELEAAEKAGSVEERAAIYKRLAELKKQWNKQGTEQGRALRQRQRFVAEDMVSAAADILYGDKSGKIEKALRKLNPQAKDAIMGKVREYARRFNDMQKNGGTVGDLVQLIKDVSVQRRTTGLLSRENGRAVDFALSEVAKQEGGVDFLKELATTQIKSIASDYLKPGIIDQIKSWRFMAMLSNAATTTANAGSNFVFGSFMEALSGDLALPFDMFMSQFTGQREVAGELGAFSKTKWQGSYDAALRSFLEVTLDAEAEQASYGYKELKGSTFKMVGNPLERLLDLMRNTDESPDMWWLYKEEDRIGAIEYAQILNRVKAGDKEALDQYNQEVMSHFYFGTPFRSL